MKSDLDALMAAAEIDALLVLGSVQHNPAMYYFTGPAHVTHAILLKKRGADPLLYHQPMERDEAAATGLAARDLSAYPFSRLLKEADGDRARAAALRYRMLLEEADFSAGRLAVYGHTDIGSVFAQLTALQSLMPDVSIHGDVNGSVLLQAMATKDGDEIERIRRMGARTTAVVGRLADYLSEQRGRDGVLVDRAGEPITVGAVKQKVNLWLAENGAENPEGTIFAIGRDAGVPHSAGNADDLLRLGETIVFDIFPREAGGGYFFDFTRTWCLRFAPDEVQELYDDVRAVFEQIMREISVDGSCQGYQRRTCELFEASGHPTVLSDPETQSGYVHSVGHGLGLHVHEKPSFSLMLPEEHTLAPGMVVTIEPGLYYPERGMGVRLEDTVAVGPDGKIEVLAEYPLDLVLPVSNG